MRLFIVYTLRVIAGLAQPVLAAVDASELEALINTNSANIRTSVAERQSLDAYMQLLVGEFAAISKEIELLNNGTHVDFILRIKQASLLAKAESLKGSIDTIKAKQNYLSEKLKRSKSELIQAAKTLVRLLSTKLRGMHSPDNVIVSKLILYSFVIDRLQEKNQFYDRNLAAIKYETGDSKEDILEKIAIAEDFISKIDSTLKMIDVRKEELVVRKDIYAHNKNFFGELSLFSDEEILQKTYKKQASTPEVFIMAIKDPQRSPANTAPAANYSSSTREYSTLQDTVGKQDLGKGETFVQSYVNCEKNLESADHESKYLLSIKEILSKNIKQLKSELR